VEHLVHGSPSVSNRLSQRLERDIEPYLVPVLEQVGNRLGDRVHPDRHAFDLVYLDAVCERIAREADDAQRRDTLHRLAGPRVDRQPHLPLVLDSQAMKHQRRLQAHHSMWNEGARNGKRVPFGSFMVGGDIDAAGNPSQFARPDQLAQPISADPQSSHIPAPDHAAVADHLNVRIGRSVGHGAWRRKTFVEMNKYRHIVSASGPRILTIAATALMGGHPEAGRATLHNVAHQRDPTP